MEKTTYFGNSWIGMFIKTNNSVTLLPIDSMQKLESTAKESLKTETVKVSIEDCNLLGLYVAMNGNGIVVPNIIREEEIAILRKTGLNVYVSNEKNNAHGNNITVNDKGGIANPHLDSQELKKMEDVLGVEIVQMHIAGYYTVGSSCMATNKGFLSHYKASEDEMRAIKDALKVDGERGTVNTGAGFVSYGVVINENGYMIGENTTAFEVGRAIQALGLVK
ncbi:translation initiation factor IF-6 [Candidatus Micrarchaeota archaeon]|nr:translation initiation factor IF-6 [Candidatus Micrarchaeota archaeon]